jgi:hypothetical protein
MTLERRYEIKALIRAADERDTAPYIAAHPEVDPSIALAMGYGGNEHLNALRAELGAEFDEWMRINEDEGHLAFDSIEEKQAAIADAKRERFGRA